MTHTSTIERAFQLAKDGTHSTADDIVSQLNREGFLDAQTQLSGPSIRWQLARSIALAKGAKTSA